MNYVIGNVQRGPRSCVLTSLQGVEDDYELRKGISRAEGFPPDAYFRMDPDFPKSLQLEDFLLNENSLLVVSERVRTLVEAEKLKNNELLPVQIKDHKNKRVKESYYILNQLELQDCIDLKESKLVVNDIDPDTFMDVDKLVIDEKRVDRDVKVFRMKRYAVIPVFRRDFAAKVKAANLTGIRFTEVCDFESF
jgi:hypothetical protein